MKQHFLDGSETQPFWDNSVEPRLEINPGDEVIFDCPEPTGQMTPDWTVDTLEQYDHTLAHALVGSVYVKGTQPGDALEVEVLEFQHKGWGWSGHIPEFGLLAEEFDYPYLHHWRLDGETCHFGVQGITLPFQPFCGVMGVAPAETGRFDTTPPRANGGNIDIRHLGPGAKVWFPTFVPGALFACGDCHSAQGDGEVCGTGIESPMTVTLRFNVRKGANIPELQFETPAPLDKLASKGYFATTAHGPNLMENTKNAVRYMIDWLVRTKGLTRSQAYVLCSTAADLKISEVVDLPNFIVSAYMPLQLFAK